jgi:hypothetical protein
MGLFPVPVTEAGETKLPQPGNYCSECPPGQYQEGQWCQVCPENQYQDQQGATNCKQCDQPCEKLIDPSGAPTQEYDTCINTNIEGYSWLNGTTGCNDGAKSASPCKTEVQGNGECNEECNRFIAKNEDGVIVEAGRSFDMGDCSAAMAPLILQAHMLIQIGIQNDDARSRAKELLHKAMRLATPELTGDQQKCTDQLGDYTKPLQCEEYYRQRDFHDLAQGMVNRLPTSQNDGSLNDGVFVADGMSGWELSLVRERHNFLPNPINILPWSTLQPVAKFPSAISHQVLLVIQFAADYVPWPCSLFCSVVSICSQS